MNEFEERNRQLKVDTVVAHVRSVHATLKSSGVLGEFSTPLQWIQHPHFPFDAMRRASGAKTPCSPTSKAMVLEELGG